MKKATGYQVELEVDVAGEGGRGPVFMSQEAALKDATETIAYLIKDILETFGFEGEERALLDEITELIGEGKHKDAIDEWNSYASDVSGRKVTVHEVDVIS